MAEKEKGKPKEASYVVYLPLRFTAIALLCSFSLAFFVGQGAKYYLLSSVQHDVDYNAINLQNVIDNSESDTRKNGNWKDSPFHHSSDTLPIVVLQDGKMMPKTVYTSRVTDTSTPIASMHITKGNIDADDSPNTRYKDERGSWRVCSAGGNESCSSSYESSNNVNDDEEHLPAGQHLLIDIKNVSPDFLDSENKLAQAMIDLVNESKLTLISYHCHKLEPTGVSCAGVLLESHVSFHTWPEEGVIMLDLFTCGSGALLPVVPLIMKLFGVPDIETDDEPEVLWAHKLRGFRDVTKRAGPLESLDLGRNILGVMDFDMKKEVRSKP